MTTLSKEINILKTGPDIYYVFDNWYSRHYEGTLIDDLAKFYWVSRQEIVEFIIAIVNPLNAWKLNKIRPLTPWTLELQENLYCCLTCFTHLKLSYILHSPIFSALFEYLIKSGELDLFASTDETFMANPLRYMFIIE